jgi:hypothetical protein
MSLSVIQKLAFICNSCLLLALALKQYNFLADGDLKSTIIVMGYFLSFLVNAVAVIWWWLSYFNKSESIKNISPIFAVINSFFFALQIYLILK